MHAVSFAPPPPAAPTAAPSKLDGQSRYGWLAALLRARIQQGEWVPGSALPAESALAKQQGVALGTVRQSIAVLVKEGLLERRHGHGTFVCAGLGGASMLRFFRFRQGDDFKAIPQSTILKRQITPAKADTADALGISAGVSALKLLRLRSLGGQPCLLEQLWLPLPTFETLATSDTATWGDVLYPLYQRVCGITVYRAEDTLRFTTLSASQARYLNLAPAHPCVQVDRRAFDLTGRCIEHRRTWGDAHAFNYTLHIH
jgi:GntR family transcriptional regulator